MNFGWLEATPLADTTEFNRVVLHEFGHALGMIHEHQNPIGNPIKWNKDSVYAYYVGNNIFTKEQVDEFVFALDYQANGTSFDKESIMLYAIPPSFTTDGFSVPWNTQLSKTDKAFIKKRYNSTRPRF